jgi:hypothetical protein
VENRLQTCVQAVLHKNDKNKLVGYAQGQVSKYLKYIELVC